MCLFVPLGYLFTKHSVCIQLYCSIQKSLIPFADTEYDFSHFKKKKKSDGLVGESQNSFSHTRNLRHRKQTAGQLFQCVSAQGKVRNENLPWEMGPWLREEKRREEKSQLREGVRITRGRANEIKDRKHRDSDSGNKSIFCEKKWHRQAYIFDFQEFPGWVL